MKTWYPAEMEVDIHIEDQKFRHRENIEKGFQYEIQGTGATTPHHIVYDILENCIFEVRFMDSLQLAILVLDQDVERVVEYDVIRELVGGWVILDSYTNEKEGK